MPLPTVTRDALTVVLEQFRDHSYQHAALNRMKRDNPLLADALDAIAGRLLQMNDDGDTARFVVQSMLIQYIAIENQFEAECLEREIG